MRVALTGTPGTGKTTASERLPYPTLHLNDAVREHDLWTEEDTDRDSLVVDVDALAAWVDDHVEAGETVVLESHLAHLLDADRVVVLRCRPDVLESRLRERGESDAKAAENSESEALDVVLSESVQRHGEERVYEIDTTERTPEDVAAEIEAVVDGDREPSAGTVDFTDYLHP
ncbi:adenylate kinase [Salinigranum rubrum]|uniref:Putative adenylate kinase n=1 Tax=Salinigranum rubrum TaxID=755307 RepID=A0A2I8VKN8_9EURY|nr:adenylate kinase family protein [Salinigranum rubrum]AUV81649.1 adenylate kinase [Salinigranum rubrum]